MINTVISNHGRDKALWISFANGYLCWLSSCRRSLHYSARPGILWFLPLYLKVLIKNMFLGWFFFCMLDFVEVLGGFKVTSLGGGVGVFLSDSGVELRPLNAPLSVCVPWPAPHERHGTAAHVLPTLNHRCFLPVRRNYKHVHRAEIPARSDSGCFSLFSHFIPLQLTYTLWTHQLNCNCLYWLSPERHGMNHSSPPPRPALTPRWSFTSERSSAGFVWACSQLWPSNMWAQTGNLCLTHLSSSFFSLAINF